MMNEYREMVLNNKMAVVYKIGDEYFSGFDKLGHVKTTSTLVGARMFSPFPLGKLREIETNLYMAGKKVGRTVVTADGNMDFILDYLSFEDGCEDW